MKSLEITITLVMVIYCAGVQCVPSRRLRLEKEVWINWELKTFGKFSPQHNQYLCYQGYKAAYPHEALAENYSYLDMEHDEERVLVFRELKKSPTVYKQISPFLRCRVTNFDLNFWILHGTTDPSTYFVCLEYYTKEEENSQQDEIVLYVHSSFVPQ